MSKKYFLRDEELHSVDEDFFRHRDVADNIFRILDNNNPPYNIAVIGKWGLGKSSLINLVKERLVKDEEYVIVDINAWKYEKEVLGKVFLRQVIEGVDENENKETQQEKSANLIKNIFKIIFPQEPYFLLKDFFKRLFRYWYIPVIYLVITLGLYIFYEKFILQLNNQWPVDGFRFRRLVFTGYCRNVAVLLFAPILLTISAEAMTSIKKRALDKVEFHLPDISVEDYEIELKKAIDRKREKKKNIKIVIVLEDLDRLSLPKMVEALDAIKMFINFPNCIFIVPFDDSIIKAAIKKLRTDTLSKTGVLIEEELLLDKLFQYKIYLAPLLSYDIRKYAVDLCLRNLTDFTLKYCDEKIFEKVIREVLIHREVQTPRQVKKLINIFVSNMMIAREREEAGEVEKGFATSKEGAFMIAKLSVLQADFNEFYDLLFEIPEAMEIALEAQREAKKIESMPKELQDYFKITKDNKLFGKEYSPLFNFLNATSKHKVESLVSYLYVAMDDISIMTGSAKQQEFVRAATSGNAVEVSRLIKETPTLVEAAILYIEQEVEIEDVKKIVGCMLQEIPSLSLENMKRIAMVIAKRAEEIANNWSSDDEEDCDFSWLLVYYDKCENKAEFSKIVMKCLRTYNKELAAYKVKCFAENIEKLNQEEIEAFNHHIKGSLEESWIKLSDFIEIKTENDLYDEMWIKEYYEFLVRGISSQKNYSNAVLSELRETFECVKNLCGLNYCVNGLKLLYADKNLAYFFYDILVDENLEEVSLDLLGEMAALQIVGEIEKKEEVNKLLSILPYKVEKGKESFFNDYFTEQFKEDGFGKVIHQFAKYNDIKLIDKCIQESIKWLSQNLDERKVLYWRDIINVLSEQRRREMLEKIKNLGTFSSSKSYEYLDEMVISYAECAWDEIYAWISSIVSTINNYSSITDSYLAFSFNCYEQLHDKLSEDEIEAYMKAILAKVKQNRCVDTCVKILCSSAKYISDTLFLEAEPVIYGKLNEVNCAEIFNAYKHKRHTFTKENGNLSNLVEVCLLAIEHTRFKNEAISTLDLHFKWTSQVPRLVKAIVEHEEIDKKIAYKICSKFIEQKGISDETTDVLKILREHSYVTVDIILGNCREEIRKEIADEICAKATSMQEEDILNYLGYLVRQDGITYNAQINNLVNVAAIHGETEAEYEKIVDILERMHKDQFKGTSKKYITPIITLLNNTTSENLVERIMKVCTRIKIASAVLRQVSEGMNKKLKKYVNS